MISNLSWLLSRTSSFTYVVCGDFYWSQPYLGTHYQPQISSILDHLLSSNNNLILLNLSGTPAHNRTNQSLFHGLTPKNSSLPRPPNPSVALDSFTNFIIIAAEASIIRTLEIQERFLVSEEIHSARIARQQSYRTNKSSHTQIDVIASEKAHAKARTVLKLIYRA